MPMSVPTSMFGMIEPSEPSRPLSIPSWPGRAAPGSPPPTRAVTWPATPVTAVSTPARSGVAAPAAMPTTPDASKRTSPKSTPVMSDARSVKRSPRSTDTCARSCSASSMRSPLSPDGQADPHEPAGQQQRVADDHHAEGRGDRAVPPRVEQRVADHVDEHHAAELLEVGDVLGVECDVESEDLAEDGYLTRQRVHRPPRGVGHQPD